MKIAIYYPWLYLKSGLERTILETVKKSKHSYTIYTNHYDKKGTFPEFKTLNVIELKRVPVRRNLFSVIVAAKTIMLQKVNLKDFDLLVVHSEGLGDLFLLRNKHKKTVCYCHTPLRPVFDKEYKRLVMEKRHYLKRPLYILLNLIFTHIDRFFWKKYSFIFFNSKETLNRAIAGGLINKNSEYKILHPGINFKHKNPSTIHKNYFLVPGRIMWTKNIELAIESFLFFRNITKCKFKLIIAGQVDQKSKPYLKYLKKLTKKTSSVTFEINPDDTKMTKLYRGCLAALTTSFNEDWGITPLEANSHGKPVIAVKKGGFKESQINNKTGFLVEPDPETIAFKMLELVSKPANTLKMGRYAFNHSQKYHWKYFIDKYDKVLQNINSAQKIR
jgi:glycosyltransferase involved in cell wall biosynthesis